MNFSLRMRLALYVLALVLTTGFFGGGGLAVWRKRDIWEAQARQFQIESVTLAENYKAAFQVLNYQMLRYEIYREPADLNSFQQSADELTRWLEEHSRSIRIPESREVLGQIASEFTNYLQSSATFLANLPPPDGRQPAKQMLLRAEKDAQHILALDSRLGDLQRRVFDSFVTRTREDMDWFWQALYAGMVVMLICVTVLARLVYRDLIAPLRRTVLQSRALLERQEKLSALGLLTAGLAHEIRNPLNSIKARLFTQRRVLGESSPGLEDNRFIDEEIDRLEGIVKDALRFAKPGEPMVQQQRMTAIAEPLCELLRPALVKSAIDLKTDFQADPEISADPNQIKQALLNLVNNAAESIGQKGTITLRTRFLAHRRAPLAVVEVQDTGPGIAPEVQKRLFDPFFTTKASGTGLGLSITARIVSQHGGAIECVSEPGRGALFRILLPVATNHEKIPHPAH